MLQSESCGFGTILDVLKVVLVLRNFEHYWENVIVRRRIDFETGSWCGCKYGISRDCSIKNKMPSVKVVKVRSCKQDVSKKAIKIPTENHRLWNNRRIHLLNEFQTLEFGVWKLKWGRMANFHKYIEVRIFETKTCMGCNREENQNRITKTNI